MKKILSATILSASLAFPLSALAVDVPSNADSGKLQGKFTKQKIEAKVDKSVLVKDENTDLPTAKAEAVKFKLDSIQLQNNKALAAADLQDIYQDKIGSTISLADLYKIRDEITKRYRQKGYILSRAVIPVQDFSKSGAKVKIRVIEGYVDNVTKQGETGGSEGLINYYINQIKQEGPLNSANLEKYLLLMNDLPGVTATATLQPAKEGTGAADVVINLSHKTYDGSVTLDNSGTKFVGRHIASGELNINSPLGIFDKLTLRTIATTNINELKFGDVVYQVQLGQEGTTLKLEYSKTRTNPGSTIKNLDLEGDTSSYSAEVSHPVIRSRAENLSVRTSFEAKNNNTDSISAELYEDKTRTITVGGTYDLADSWGGINVFDLAAHQGFDAFGSTSKTSSHSRANGESVFTKFNLEASRLQEVGNGFAVLFAAQGQYSLDPLYASEEFGAGGTEFGRGYDFSEITGEQGIAAKVEVQYGEHLGYDYLADYQLYSFFDQGTVWQRDRIVGSEKARDSLNSIGIGTRLNIVTNLSGYLELAKPLNRDVASENDKDTQLNMGVTYLF